MIRFKTHNDFIGLGQTGNTGGQVNGIPQDTMSAPLQIKLSGDYEASVNARVQGKSLPMRFSTEGLKAFTMP